MGGSTVAIFAFGYICVAKSHVYAHMCILVS